jgi:hypothetical protein
MEGRKGIEPLRPDLQTGALPLRQRPSAIMGQCYSTAKSVLLWVSNVEVFKPVQNLGFELSLLQGSFSIKLNVLSCKGLSLRMTVGA